MEVGQQRVVKGLDFFAGVASDRVLLIIVLDDMSGLHGPVFSDVVHSLSLRSKHAAGSLDVRSCNRCITNRARVDVSARPGLGGRIDAVRWDKSPFS